MPQLHWYLAHFSVLTTRGWQLLTRQPLPGACRATRGPKKGSKRAPKTPAVVDEEAPDASGSFDEASSSSGSFDADDLPAQAPDAEAIMAEGARSSADAAEAAAAKDATVTVKRRKTRKVWAVAPCNCHYVLKYSFSSGTITQIVPSILFPRRRIWEGHRGSAAAPVGPYADALASVVIPGRGSEDQRGPGSRAATGGGELGGTRRGARHS